MNVEIYIENKDGEFESLDLFKDESIPLKFKLKDSNDLSKIFSTYSQGFTIPASDTNNRLLNYYFDSSVIRDSKRYINAKIYVKKQLYKVGLISINDSKFKDNRITQYSINFFTSLTSLKDMFGDELLTETLAKGVVTPYKILWDDGRIFYYTLEKGTPGLGLDPDVIVPLASNKRVWTFGDSGINDIKYNSSTPSGVKFIEPSELKPAIPFSKIMTGIQQSSGLTFKSPLFNSDAYKKLYVWCNDSTQRATSIFVKMSHNWTMANTDYTVSNVINSDVIKITYNLVPDANNTKLYFNFVPYSFNEKLPNDSVINYRFINADTNQVLKEDRFLNNRDQFYGFLDINTAIYPNIRTSGLNVKLQITQNNDGLNWRTLSINIFRLIRGSTLLGSAPSVNNFSTTIDLFRALPDIKTVDFLASFIKMFNISIIETNNIKEVNFIPRNTFYQEEVDYTDSIDIEEFSVKPTKLYKSINFKHKTSQYNSNKSFLKGSGREFGQELYTSNDDNIKDSIEIKTEFTIVPNTIIGGTTINTFYGFGEDYEENATYGKLYKPNTKDFTVFYYNGVKDIKELVNEVPTNSQVGFKVSDVPNVTNLPTYNKVSIAYSDVNDSTFINSLGYHKEVDINAINFVYDKNLFSNYYVDEIEQLYNPNTRLFEYNGYLTQKQVMEFNLKKEVIIERRRFSIEEADIDVVTGKSKIVFQSRPPKPIAMIPPAPLTFTVKLIPS